MFTIIAIVLMALVNIFVIEKLKEEKGVKSNKFQKTLKKIFEVKL